MQNMLFTIVICGLFLIANAQVNNVCKNYIDYLTKAWNPNCWYNPDVDAPPSDIINRHGFPFESHKVTTEDGHILSLFRIPHNNNTNINQKRQPIYLQHGFALSSNIFFDTERSIAYVLSREGYDVWIGNFRGTRYSRNHIKYTTQDPEFWDFSWTAHGNQDISANVNLIKNITRQKVILVGFSMGSTASYVYAIDKKVEAEQNLKGIVSLAPIAYLRGFKSPIIALLPFRNSFIPLSKPFNQHGVYKYPHFQQTISNLIVDQYPLIQASVFVCFLILGFDWQQLPPQDVPVFFSGFPDAFSIYTLVHYAQEVANNGRFQKYDYGTDKNLKMYGSNEPPEYDVKQINICVHLIYGKADYLSTTKDVHMLHENLKCSTIDSVAPYDDPPFNHLDFLYGKDVETKLYPIFFKRISDIVSNNDEDDNIQK